MAGRQDNHCIYFETIGTKTLCENVLLFELCNEKNFIFLCDKRSDMEVNRDYFVGWRLYLLSCITFHSDYFTIASESGNPLNYLHTTAGSLSPVKIVCTHWA